MGYYLDGFTQIVAVTLTVDNCFVDASCGDAVVMGGVDACEPFVMSQVEVGFHTVGCHVALAVLVGIQCAWVDVDVGIELLDGYFVATCL